LRNRAVSATPTEVLAARTPRPTFGGGSSGSRRTCRTARDGRSGGARLDLRMPAAVPRRAPRRGAVLAPHRAFRLQPPRPPGGGALRPLRPSAHRLLAVKTVAILRECSCAWRTLHLTRECRACSEHGDEGCAGRVRGHDIREIEEIIDEADGYVVVAKLGTGGAVAERLPACARETRSTASSAAVCGVLRSESVWAVQEQPLR
jgi:hypothetical protein